jgi:SAM-dependent methyltransferase
MFRPGIVLEEFRVELNGTPLGTTRPFPREDVQQAFPFAAEARMSGFQFRARVHEVTVRDWANLDVIGTTQGRDVTRLNVLYRSDFDASLPEPPVDLRYRVTNSRCPVSAFWLDGLSTFTHFVKWVRKRGDLKRIKRWLDWGCGCGRHTGFLVKYLKDIEIYGSDIDQEAVEWCVQHFPGGRFAVLDPFPPTRYPDQTFDVITGCSIFTHLRREVQLDWLQEMRRILIPGGLFLTSLHGTSLAQLLFTAPTQLELEQNGILDNMLDQSLDGIAPAGYYRCVFQSKSYTYREFSRYLKIVDYIEQGMGNRQDLVVMTRES